MLVGVDAGRSLACEPRPARLDEWAVIKVSAMTSGVFRADQAKPLPAAVLPDRRHEIRCGDLLISRANTTAYVGASVLVPAVRSRLLLSDKSLRLRPKPEYDARWLQLMLSSPPIRDAISAKASGTKDSMRNIGQRVLLDLDLPDVSLAEQYRIVAVLEDHLSHLDAASDYVHAAAMRIDRLLQASRDDLVAGPESQLSAFLAEPLRNGHSAPADPAGRVRTLTLTAVTAGAFVQANTKMTAADQTKVRGLWLKFGDILVQRSNTPQLVGTSALYEGQDDWAIFPDLLIRVRVDPDRLRPAYAAMALASTRSTRRFRSRAKGLAGSMPKIDQETIATTPLRVPTVSKQDEAIRRFGAIALEAIRQQAALEVTRSRSKSLRRSVLSAAISGRL